MADETHKLQKDPPEGSRKVIEHELERQSGKANAGDRDPAAAPPANGTGESSGKHETESHH